MLKRGKRFTWRFLFELPSRPAYLALSPRLPPARFSTPQEEQARGESGRHGVLFLPVSFSEHELKLHSVPPLLG